ncbi:MAG: ABC transporter ATP-binding protein [Thaumarchaeota archaeon]|nr:ABC transporter ATP-binding protein [Nitrososphaerota archaeon]
MAEIFVEGLSKSYGDVVALDDVSLRCETGEVFGLLGPNGAGKSTLLKIVVGLLKPTSGIVRLGEHDIAQSPEAAKQIVGYLPENPSLYTGLTVQEFLQFVGKIRGVDDSSLANKVDESLRTFSLVEKTDSLIGSLSKGMKQKVALIASTIHDPSVLVLDEPLTALDPRTQRLVKDWIGSQAGRGVTTLLSTHLMEIAQSYCTRLAIIDKGKIVASGGIDALREKAAAGSEANLDEIFLRLTDDSGDA